jgi:hypothetical protein
MLLVADSESPRKAAPSRAISVELRPILPRRGPQHHKPKRGVEGDNSGQNVRDRARPIRGFAGLVATVTLVAEMAIGHNLDHGIDGLSPCLFFGVYGSLVLYGRAAYFPWKRHSHEGDLPAHAAHMP